ncbi:4-hydroxy 2-oxovalerate aldolase [Pseudobutyrivibrio sp. UC1225]|uniref:aldolase catalytic domain-containing protein n=1 Tax=Pseudobutyrivibrio sp. UC1225 TaxID=1798185 RepID=UPI0008E75446|nr:aldolase catalytic domain-containing protein [Pseudobutyrivibrio sp. UC1225]SFN79186.1 4-hydroxy 2-oxovalerate aldolase [Pseudobutyrivibrio sp. UC1225]
MGEILSLDCTLRDGGYCNNWNFREKNIEKIINGLAIAGVDIIECGFLTSRVSYNQDISKYTDLKQIEAFISKEANKSEYVVMMNLGEYKLEDLPDAAESVIGGIRLAFHKKSLNEAMTSCKIIKQKGYKLYMQPMVTMLYSDDEFIELISKANELNPYAFYIVDSFGTMDEDILLHYFQIADKEINENTYIGFHSHNNLQGAFSNCKSLLKSARNRNIIIDSSIYGMGRGAGNLNSELFLNELNSKYGKNYEIKPLLRIMDEVLSRFYNEKPWGYSLPNYLSAAHMVHPNYAKYLTSKEALLLEDMDEIFSLMDKDKAVEYDEEYINDLYMSYMSRENKNKDCIAEIQQKVSGREVLLIAPGASAKKEEEKIAKFVENNKPIVISINHEYAGCNVDYIFVSNIRRFNQLSEASRARVIATSNIHSGDIFATIDYKILLNDIDGVKDNAGLMAIKFAVEELGVNDIYLAGYDGYLKDSRLNYESDDLTVFISEESIDRMNIGMNCMIRKFKEKSNIKFITKTYLDIYGGNIL